MNPPRASLADAEVIDQICDQFEQGWRTGTRSALEAHLEAFQGNDRAQLFVELLKVELEWRRGGGERPSASEYAARFPSFAEQVARVFTTGNASTGAGDRPHGPSSRPSARGMGLGAATTTDRIPERDTRRTGGAPSDAARTPRTSASGSGTGSSDQFVREPGMQVRCPYCRELVTIREGAPLVDIACPSCGSTFSLAGEADTVAYAPVWIERLGRFEILQKVGAGAFGTVWKARDTQLDRFVAIKVPRESVLDATGRELFLRDARNAAPLRHSNIVSILEVGCEPETGTLYIVSDFIDGLTLSDWLSGQQPSLRDAMSLCKTIANALHAAHERGVVHRDVKPSNIMLDRQGRPHVLDFGLARRQTDVTVTHEGHLLGTPAYMSPEQARGEAHSADCRSDVYSLGVILFELMTGERPFRGNPRMLVHQVLTEPAPSPRTFNSHIPRDLETVCLKCLEKEPHKRYPTALALAEELERIERGEPIKARPIGRIERAWRWCRRHPVVAAWSGISFALLLVIATVSSLAYFRELNYAVRVQGLAEQNEERRKDAERNLAELKVELARNAFAHGLGTYSASRFDWADRHFHRAVTLLSNEHPLRRPYLDVCWDRATRGGRSWLPALRHDGPIVAAVFHPEGDRLVTASDDKTLQLWNARTAVRIGNPIPCDVRVLAVQFTPDGENLVVRTEGAAVFVLRARDGERRHEFVDPSNEIQAVAVDRQGEKIVTAGGDFTARIWSLKTGEMLHELVGHAERINFVAFDSTSTRVVTASDDNTAIVWNAETGKTAVKPCEHLQGVNRGVFSPDDSRLLTVSNDNTARLWNAATGDPLCPPMVHEGAVLRGEFSPDGRHVATVSRDDMARVWSTLSGLSVGNPIRHGTDITAEAFSPDGLWLATANADGTARLANVRTGTFVGEPLRHSHAINSLAFDRDGTTLLTASSDGTARLWELSLAMPQPVALSLAEGTPRAVDPRRLDPLHHLSLSETGDVGVSVCEDHALRVLSVSPDVRELSLSRLIRHAHPVAAGAVSRDGRFVLTACRDSSGHLWNRLTGTSIRELPLEGTPQSLAFSGDGKRFVATFGRTARLFETASLKALDVVFEHDDDIRCASFSPNGDRVVTASNDRTVRVFGASGVARLLVTLRHDDAVFSANFSRDGERIITASRDNSARVWDAQTGELVADPMWHDGAVYCATFSSDGVRCATASADRMVRVWDATTGAQLGEALPHPAAVSSLCFVGAGQRLLTACHDRQVRLWELFPEAPTSRLAGSEMSKSGPPRPPVRSADANTRGSHTAESGGSGSETTSEANPAVSQSLRLLSAFVGAEVSTTWAEVVKSDPWWNTQLDERLMRDIAFHRAWCESPPRAKRHFAVVFHLKRLQSLHPHDRALAEKLAAAERALPPLPAPLAATTEALPPAGPASPAPNPSGPPASP